MGKYKTSFNKEKDSERVLLRTGVYRRVLFDELIVGDLELSLDRITLISRANFMELIAVGCDTGLGGGLAVVSGCRSSRGCGCTRYVDADVVVQPDVGAF